MKLQNPFSRLRKKDFIPMSLFPCNKVTRTSMPVGRLVPLYTLEMMQNNRAKISCSQLTRFLTMSAPVMQNFEITFGAFFCPYLALDDFFVKSSARANLYTNNYDSFALHANEFFDPSTAERDRIHPITKKVSFLSPEAFKAGSLIDHLQYKVFSELPTDYLALGQFGQVYIENWFEFDNINLFGLDESPTTHEVGWTDKSSGNVPFAVQDKSDYTFEVPFPLAFILCSPYYDGTQERQVAEDIVAVLDRNAGNQYSYSQALRDNLISDPEDYDLGHECVTIFNDFKSDYEKAFRKYFTGLTLTQASQLIINFYKRRFVKRSHSDVSANVTRWLVYQRIYSDYFLPDEYVDCERYRAMIGDGYAAAATTTNTLADCFTAGIDGFQNLWMFNNDNDPAVWYAPYLRNGECMPVLWDMNQFTALKPKDDKGDPTAIGASVEQNFYQRQLARFKGLVRRMGFDVQNNLDSIYGGHVTDETLRKSQVIGFKKFDVSIGDVAKTSSDGVDKNLGDFAGYAVSRDSMGAFDWTANQNGMLMICAYIRPKYTAIVNSMPRDLLKTNYFDYLLPQFGGVGYQDVTYKQLSPNGKSAHDNKVFGKQEIYSEYMSLDNECSGRMATDCRHYNMDRIVSPDIETLTNPKNLTFLYMTDADDLHRCFVDKENDPCLISAFFQGNVTRQLPSTIRVEY